MSTLYVQKLSATAKIPVREYPTDAGADLYSDERVVIPPFSSRSVNTNICIDIPDPTTLLISDPDQELTPELTLTWELQVRSKSGLAKNYNLIVLNSPGTIDHGFTDNIIVVMYNASSVDYTVQPQQKIAQIILAPIVCADFTVVNAEQFLDYTSNKFRKNNGFGSTGL